MHTTNQNDSPSSESYKSLNTVDVSVNTAADEGMEHQNSTLVENATLDIPEVFMDATSSQHGATSDAAS